jgi:hypothetical protein
MIEGRFRYKSQLTPADFAVKEIRVNRKLERDPMYRPNFVPAPRKSTLEVQISPEALSLLQPLRTTGQYGESDSTVVLACFVRWFNQNRVKDRVSKLSIRS